MKETLPSEHLKALYDNYYDDAYETGGGLDSRWLDSFDKAKNVANLCDAIPHATVLDIGCGDGAILKRLSDEQFADSFYGLEISQTGIKLAKKRGINRLVECKLYDGYRIPYEDNQFDLAILSHIVEHLEHPRILLYEAARVADYVFVEVPLEDNFRQKNNYNRSERKDGHINVYSPRTLRWLLQSSGFVVVQQIITIPSFGVFHSRYGPKMFLIYPLLKTAVQLLPNKAAMLFTYHCAILCKKNTSP